MNTVACFWVLPEAASVHQSWWLKSIEIAQIPEALEMVERFCEATAMEQVSKYYDADNFGCFLADAHVVEDYYPSPPRVLLGKLVLDHDMHDWRENDMPAGTGNCMLFGQSVSGSLLDAMYRHAKQSVKDGMCKAVLLDVLAVTWQKKYFELSVGGNVLRFENVSDEQELSEWFAQHRDPPRRFHTTQKHGADREETMIWHNRQASPLKCSVDEAQWMLNRAIGLDERELFYFDQAKGVFILFKYEGPTPQNQYHGYHLPQSEEQKIDARIRQHFGR